MREAHSANMQRIKVGPCRLCSSVSSGNSKALLNLSTGLSPASLYHTLLSQTLGSFTKLNWDPKPCTLSPPVQWRVMYATSMAPMRLQFLGAETKLANRRSCFERSRGLIGRMLMACDFGLGAQSSFGPCSVLFPCVKLPLCPIP